MHHSTSLNLARYAADSSPRACLRSLAQAANVAAAGCSSCFGGSVACSDCRGKGFLYGDATDRPCPTCQGTRRRPCLVCTR